MTGREIYTRVRAEMARAGETPSRLPPDVFLDDLNAVMGEMSKQSNVYVARDITFDITAAGGRFVRPTLSGAYFAVHALIRCSRCTASTRAVGLRIEPAWQFDGPDGALVQCRRASMGLRPHTGPDLRHSCGGPAAGARLRRLADQAAYSHRRT
jgi:hypothetical protein